MLHHWQRDGGRVTWYNPSMLRMGWFTCPVPFGRSNAGRSRALDTSPGLRYPAIFYVDEVAFQCGYTMWCEAIMVMRSRAWFVHPDRVELLGEEWDAWLEEQ